MKNKKGIWVYVVRCETFLSDSDARKAMVRPGGWHTDCVKREHRTAEQYAEYQKKSPHPKFW
jgi:hypothetical protein